MVLADAGRSDSILCQVTSNQYGDPQAIALDDKAFAVGSLRVASYARPGKLFTANRNLVVTLVTLVGALTTEAFRRIVEAVIGILRTGLVK